MGLSIALVQPRSEFNAYRLFRIPLLGSLYLGTILRDRGHKVKIHTEIMGDVYYEKTGRVLKSLLNNDIVGISTITATANRAYKIAQRIKELAPSTRVLMGGSHASFMPQEALGQADVVVRGEAEAVIADVVENSSVPSVVDGRPVENLDDLPIPDFSLSPGLSQILRYVPISTSRGCPHDCSFCAVTTMFGRRYRHRSWESTIEELDHRIKGGHHHFFFIDDNFGADPRRAKTLLTEVLRRRLSFSWVAQCRAEAAGDPELLELMALTNCRSVMIGFESTDQRTLEFYKKRQSVEQTKEWVRRLKEHAIPVHGFFMLGSDFEDSESVEGTIKTCGELGLSSAQFSVLFPIPGTQLYESLDAQGRIFNKDWSLYDGTHVVFYPMRMRAADLQQLWVKAWKRFYSIRYSWRFFLYGRYLLNQWRKINRRSTAWMKQIRSSDSLPWSIRYPSEDGESL